MFIDIIVLLLLLMALFKGLSKGLIVAVFSFLGFFIGLAAALKLSTVAAVYIGDNVSISQRWLPVLAFAVVFILVVFLVRMGARAIESVIKLAMLGWINKIGGVVLYILLYLFIFSIFLFYAEQLHLINQPAIHASVTYPYLQPLGPKFIEAIGVIFPFFKNMFTELTNFFDGLSR
jgi:membrane protein required for colicin V production